MSFPVTLMEIGLNNIAVSHFHTANWVNVRLMVFYRNCLNMHDY